jgi:hypothetical protein
MNAFKEKAAPNATELQKEPCVLMWAVAISLKYELCDGVDISLTAPEPNT